MNKKAIRKTKTKKSKDVTNGSRSKRNPTRQMLAIIETDETDSMIYNESSEEEEAAEKIEMDNSYKQWSVGENGQFIPCFSTVQKVPPGIYEMKMTHNLGFHIQKQSSLSDDIIELPMKETTEILEDFKKFWERADIFKKYGCTHKRGILLYGPPGNGKSYLIQVISRHLIKEKKGIVINLKDYENVELFLNYAGPVIRKIEKSTPIIVILEDVDNILEYSNSTLTKLLNMLDGLKQIDKVVYIATTNYIEKLQDRIANRPSRFDRKYHIGLPTAEVRRAYIENKLKPEDLKKIDIKDWVSKTKGLSIAHIKELVVSTIILGESFEESLKIMRNLSNKAHSRDDADQHIGFGNKSKVEDDEY